MFYSGCAAALTAQAGSPQGKAPVACMQKHMASKQYTRLYKNVVPVLYSSKGETNMSLPVSSV